MINRRKSQWRSLWRGVAIVGCLLLLLAAGGGAYLWLLHLRASVDTYHSPLPRQPQPGGEQTAPLARQVVLVVVDGLRCDVVPAMATLSLLQRQGASARVIARPPTVSQPAWTTLVTGAWPEISGATLLNLSESQLQPIATDHLFAAARRASLSTALIASPLWAKMIPPSMLDAHYSALGYGAAADQQAADTALRFLHNFAPNLTLIYFGDLDDVAHEAGATGRPYREAALRVDDHLRDIISSMDLGHSVLIVVSDHGQIDRGGHGDDDPQVVVTPFVAVGNAIVPGDYGTIAQTDIAPTIAAILGAPVPRLSQGIIRFEMLHADIGTRAQAEVELAEQHRDYANLYLRSIGQGSLTETAEGDVAVAVSSLEVQNTESAYELARIAVDRIDQEIAQARQQRIQYERSLRLPIALAFVCLPLAFLLLRGGRRGLWLLFCAVVTLLVYNGLFLHQGHLYSFSDIADLRLTLVEARQRVIIASAAGALLVLWRLGRDREGSILEVLLTSLGYSLLVVYLLGCQVAFAYWLNGFRVSWYIPDLRVAFWHVAALLQIVMVAGLGAVLPIVLLLVGLIYQGVTAANRRLRLHLGR